MIERRSFIAMTLGAIAVPVTGDDQFADVTFTQTNGTITPVITVHNDAPKADQVLIQVFYKGMVVKGDTVDVSETSVVPYMPGKAVAGNPERGNRGKVLFVVVTLIREIKSMKWTPTVTAPAPVQSPTAPGPATRPGRHGPPTSTP